jgi:hypothetical protein
VRRAAVGHRTRGQVVFFGEELERWRLSEYVYVVVKAKAADIFTFRNLLQLAVYAVQVEGQLLNIYALLGLSSR